MIFRVPSCSFVSFVVAFASDPPLFSSVLSVSSVVKKLLQVSQLPEQLKASLNLIPG